MAPLQLYDSLTRNIKPVTPRHHPVTVYVCGITPYDTTHLGHGFTYATADTLIRYLEYQGMQISYVQNVTDIDDPLFRVAQERGESWQDLGKRWTARFIQDMEQLNIRPPDVYPRVTDVVTDIIAMIAKLLEVGVAYAANGNIYFHVPAWSAYGQLSQLSYDEMVPISAQRGHDPTNPHLRHQLDFLLWKAQGPDEPAWESPWGPGRPGWHIECSTMAQRFLGDTVDIHGGGDDLLYPHHESEIAQAECATGQQPFVGHWFHTAMVYHEGEKMSKSLGNLVLAHDLLQRCSPDGLRLYLASHHYRQVWEYNADQLQRSEVIAHRLRAAALAPSGPKTASRLDASAAQTAFTTAMDNDLQTPQALGSLDQLAQAILAASQQGQDIEAAQQTLRDLGGVLGLRLGAEAPEERVKHGWREHLKRFQ